MTFKRRPLLGAFALLFLLAACGQPADPTAVVLPTTESPSREPAAEPAEDVVELGVASPEATTPAEPVAPTAVLVEPSESATPEPAATATISEPVQLTSAEPENAVQVMTGSTLSVKGLVDPETAVSVTVNLQMGPYTLVQTTTEVDAGSGAWAVEIQIPHSVEGAGRLKAMTEKETAVNDIQLVHDKAADDTGVSIDMLRPGKGQLAVAGHPLFFEGMVTGAIDESITIGLYDTDCTIFVARQSFSLTSGDANWNGVINLPELLNGRTCAFAYTGFPEGGLWREVQLWLPSLHPDDETIIR